MHLASHQGLVAAAMEAIGRCKEQKRACAAQEVRSNFYAISLGDANGPHVLGLLSLQSPTGRSSAGCIRSVSRSHQPGPLQFQP